MSHVDRPIAQLTGKVCMITGATSGIGEAAALALAAHDPTLFLVARSSEKAEKVRARSTWDRLAPTSRAAPGR